MPHGLLYPSLTLARYEKLRSPMSKAKDLELRADVSIVMWNSAPLNNDIFRVAAFRTEVA